MAEPAAKAAFVLDLSLAPEDVAILLRQPELRAPGQPRRPASRGTKISLVWHDTPQSDLAAIGQCLARQQLGAAAAWRLQEMVPVPGATCPPGAPMAVISETDTPPPGLPEPLLAVAAFEGQRRVLRPPSEALGVVLLQGELRAVVGSRPVCRLLLSGDEAFATARRWSALLRLSAPCDGLAVEACRLARGTAPSRPLGSPSLLRAETASDGFAVIMAHLAGVIAHHAGSVKHGAALEPVHQMRVALRRLRSAMLLFRRAVGCPALDEAAVGLRVLGHALGPARDWDVFTTGIGAAIGEAFTDDRGVRALLAAAHHRRAQSYDNLTQYLASPAWRTLGIMLAELALTRPWERQQCDTAEAAERLAELQQRKLTAFAERALQRRLDAVTAPGPDLSALPVEALHDIRLHCKRLRYAAEFFAPLFPGRATNRFLRRMAELQERLGQLNDGAVANVLIELLPGRGAVHHSAVGVVRGFVAARSGGSRRKIARVWHRFLHQDPFWI